MGTNAGAVTQSYFDEDATRTTTGVGSGSSSGVTGVGGSTGLSPYDPATYQGFDFTNVWGISQGSSRPYLDALQ